MSSVLLLLTILAVDAPLEEPPGLADWKWLREHFPMVQLEFFPNVVGPRSTIQYRAFPHHGDPEYAFLLRERRFSGIEAIVTESIDVSVEQQIMEIHLQDPTASPDEIRARLRIRESVLTDTTCPAIQVQFAAFDGLSFPPPGDQIVIHALEHHVSAGSGSGTLHIDTTDDDHPVVRWAIQTKTELAKCLSAGSNSEETNRITTP